MFRAVVTEYYHCFVSYFYSLEMYIEFRQSLSAIMVCQEAISSCFNYKQRMFLKSIR